MYEIPGNTFRKTNLFLCLLSIPDRKEKDRRDQNNFY